MHLPIPVVKFYYLPIPTGGEIEDTPVLPVGALGRCTAPFAVSSKVFSFKLVKSVLSVNLEKSYRLNTRSSKRDPG